MNRMPPGEKCARGRAGVSDQPPGCWTLYGRAHRVVKPAKSGTVGKQKVSQVLPNRQELASWQTRNLASACATALKGIACHVPPKAGIDPGCVKTRLRSTLTGFYTRRAPLSAACRSSGDTHLNVGAGLAARSEAAKEARCCDCSGASPPTRQSPP